MGEEEKTGNRKQNVGHYKPFSPSRGRREIGRRNDMCPPLSFTFSTLMFSKPSWLLHNVHQLMCWPPLTSPQPRTWLVYINFPAIPSLTHCWWPAGLFKCGTHTLSQNLRNKLPIHNPRRVKTSTTPQWKPQIAISRVVTPSSAVCLNLQLWENKALMWLRYSQEWWWGKP